MALMREYVLMEEDGNIIDFQLSSRPSGPILSNFQYHAGKRWVPLESVPEGWVDSFFKRRSLEAAERKRK
jgi:hypothetical protein